jgi:hypothetical protein
MDASHDLPSSARRIVFLDDLKFELHIFLEAAWCPHVKFVSVQD